MSVKVEFNGEQFERAFLDAVAEEVEKSAKIFRRNIQKVLSTTGKGKKAKKGQKAVHSPAGSKIPFNITGTLARSWTAGKTKRSGTKYTAKIGTKVKYAKILVMSSGSGRRNYMDGRLKWRRDTLKMIKKRLEVKRLISSAVRSLR